ncbi:hypothetical protein DPMN_034602 [Dreissena polymorpha]|uniref:Uncharacterized protein n=1 Tax=Dreissena polymorpha TaxID=45954 RepID=A0A9D4M5T1_DREPO|nr:hypothetical protein DPMN_034602 [Dreissena polymorpha]
MTMYQCHAGSKEFICVDSEATVAEGSSSADQDGALLYFVKAVCGALNCVHHTTEINSSRVRSVLKLNNQ